MEALNKDYRLWGERIYLRPITEADTDTILKWRNADFVRNNFFYRIPISPEEHLKWYHKNIDTGLAYQFIAYIRENDEPLGCVNIQRFDEADLSMESGIFLKEDAPLGKGYGTEAVSLLNREFAFKELNLRRTTARVIASNTASIKLHEKAGFREIGRAKEKIVPTGEEVVAVEFELLNPDHKNNIPSNKDK